MALRVLVGLCIATMLAWVVGMASGASVGIVIVVAGRLAWLLGIVLAVRAREWGWAALILVSGVVPGFWYAVVRLRGPRMATQPISVLRG
jgi:hypothetical protein